MRHPKKLPPTTLGGVEVTSLSVQSTGGLGGSGLTTWWVSQYFILHSYQKNAEHTPIMCLLTLIYYFYGFIICKYATKYYVCYKTYTVCYQ